LVERESSGSHITIYDRACSACTLSILQTTTKKFSNSETPCLPLLGYMPADLKVQEADRLGVPVYDHVPELKRAAKNIGSLGIGVVYRHMWGGLAIRLTLNTRYTGLPRQIPESQNITEAISEISKV